MRPYFGERHVWFQHISSLGGEVSKAIFAGGFILEEVPAFKKHLPTFMEKMADMGYSVRAISLDATTWVACPRPRTKCMYVCPHKP